VYDLVAAPLFAWMISARSFVQKLGWLAKGKRIYLLIIPSIIVYAFLMPKFPQTNDLIHDYAYLPYWFLFLLMGFVCISNTSLMDSLERNRRASLLIALLLLVTMNYLRWNDAEPETLNYLYLSMYPALAWFWVMAITGYGKKYLNKKTSFSEYATQAVYPFYIVHQTVIVILAFYVVQANDGVFPKYLFLAFSSLFLTVAICHLLIQPYALTRFLFGMKAAANPERSRRMAPNPPPLSTPVLSGVEARTLKANNVT
jgi:hypothetical protein